MLFFLCFSSLLSSSFASNAFQSTSTALDKAYIIQLAPETEFSGSLSRRDAHITTFHKRAASIEYDVRYEFKNPDVFLGVSIQATGNASDEELLPQLKAISGVESVSRVYSFGIPILPNISAPMDPMLSYSDPPQLKTAAGVGNLGSSLQMGGVDKLHARGIKGKGIKIGVVDTGVDYRHPALGGGFGPGHKIAGGASFIMDDGNVANSTDPLTTCYGGGHGTHVAGILGMDSVPGGFDIVGVAPEATIYMYKALDCAGHSVGDTIISALSQAYEDKVDIVSMSIGAGTQSFSGAVDPLADITKKLTDAGIAVIVAMANDAVGTPYSPNLYSEQRPSTETTAIGVGAISNTDFPLVYSAEDSTGSTIQYASVYPLNVSNGVDVYLLDNGCDSHDWTTALSTIEDINNTIIAFGANLAGQGCKATSAGSWTESSITPVYIMAYNGPTTNPVNSSQEDPYLSAYDTPSQGFFGTTQFINVNSVYGAEFTSNYASSGGYGKYKLNFKSSNFTSAPQPSGGLMDYYSDFGPTWHDYTLKPQISAPGGHVLSTWPLGPLGGYAILSGTSMATPYISGCFALVKSQFPGATIEEVKNRLQVTAKPTPWVFDSSILAATPQQGAGLVNAYDAIFSISVISPGQFTVTDISHTEYGTANITIENTSGSSKSYSLSHQGAGYMDYTLEYQEKNQRAIYGTAAFSQSSITIPAGQRSSIHVSVTPPSDIDPSKLPVFSGYINIVSDDKDLHIPYVGPPYSLFNTPYIKIQNSTSSAIFPRIWSYNQIVSTVDTGVLEFVAENGFGSSLPTLQWTREFRVDVLPANTTVQANNYGFDKDAEYEYKPSAFTPNSTVFGHESFGTLTILLGYNWPSGNGIFRSDTIVTGSDGGKWAVGNGDYRWLVSALRWGGVSGVLGDYDTWLGPVVRFVSE
ncbi:Minor extracellular protease [Lachnellula willkommii]|uniref:Minor extracellular protease n=1 Tax=Lachnellula willkommii TaxID=215461 RepID=A0A559MKH8_9HELO|nr:Minor extracellular protease [Lachnellula willkommii]